MLLFRIRYLVWTSPPNPNVRLAFHIISDLRYIVILAKVMAHPTDLLIWSAVYRDMRDGPNCETLPQVQSLINTYKFQTSASHGNALRYQSVVAEIIKIERQKIRQAKVCILYSA